MEKPNISRLAREIEGECGKKESIEEYLKRIERTERHLKRIKRDRRIREYVEDRSSEWLSLDGKITNPFSRAGKHMVALGYLSKNDPPYEE
jgi:N-glycosylase/DNA lyase